MNILARISVIFLVLFAVAAPAGANGDSCAAHVAQWLDPASGKTLKPKRLFKRLKKSDVVLLGESHTSIAHHRWQHYMLAALHSLNSNMVVAFEMLPRSVQPALDDWSAGRIDEEELLERTRWQQVWGYDADLYLPLLHFVRQHRLPAVAMNVDRELVSLVGEKGWDAVDVERREGVSAPAPASQAYRESLARLYAYKKQMSAGEEIQHGQQAAEVEKVMDDEAFNRFVEAQLTWDRAMAEAMAAAHARDTGALVVGIVGRGHLEYGHGIPHQLASLGIDTVDVLLPLNADDECDSLPAGLADAVFVVDADGAAAAPPRPRLGVFIEDGEDGVKVLQVVEDSVAAASGIEEGDLIQSAAGFDTRSSAELIEIIQRQAPGTWLPLRLLRGDETIDKVARFPRQFE